MDESGLDYRFMDYCILLIGGGAACWIISHFKLVIQTKKDWTAASLAVLGFIALGFFTIATPKITKLALRMGETLLQVGKLEQQVQEKKLAIANLENQLIDLRQEEISKISAQVSEAIKGGKQFVAADGNVGMTVKIAKSLAPSEIWNNLTNGRPEDKWLLLKEHARKGKPASIEQRDPGMGQPLLYDTRTGTVRPLMVDHAVYNSLLNQIPKLRRDAANK
jgi:hypothetical protein